MRVVIGKNYLNLNALFCLKGRAKGHFLYLDFKSAIESGCNRTSLVCWVHNSLLLESSLQEAHHGPGWTRSVYSVFWLFSETRIVWSRCHWQHFRSLYGGALTEFFLLREALCKLLCFSKLSCLFWDAARPLMWVVCSVSQTSGPKAWTWLCLSDQMSCRKQAASAWGKLKSDVCEPV